MPSDQYEYYERQLLALRAKQEKQGFLDDFEASRLGYLEQRIDLTTYCRRVADAGRFRDYLAAYSLDLGTLREVIRDKVDHAAVLKRKAEVVDFRGEEEDVEDSDGRFED